MRCGADEMAVVTLNWNSYEILRSFLPSVMCCSETEDTKIYVADNGSTNASIEMPHQELPSIHLTMLDRSRDFAKDYSLVLQRVPAKHVVLLNSDVEVTGHWLTPLVNYMDTHPEVTTCQPKIRSWRHKERFKHAGATSELAGRYGYPSCHGRIMRVVEKDNGQYGIVVPIFWTTGAALFIRLKDYQNAGELDGRLFARIEEIDLRRRLRVRKRMLVCVPQGTVYHIGGAALKKESSHKTFLNFRNNLVTLYKNLSEEELDHMIRMRAMLDCVAALSLLSRDQSANM